MDNQFPQPFPLVTISQDQLEAEAELIKQSLLKYDPFEMLTALMFVDLWTPEKVHEGMEQRGIAPVIDYAASIYLKHSYVTQAHKVDTVILYEMHKNIQTLLNQISFAFTPLTSMGEIEADAINNARHHTFRYELLIGPAGYDRHLTEELTSLFSPHSEWFLKNVHFNLEDVCAVRETVIAEMYTKLEANRGLVSDCEGQIRNELAAFKEKGTVDDESRRPTLEWLISLSEEQTNNAVYNLSFNAVFELLSQNCNLTFTALEIASATELPIERVEACLKFFATEFGSVSSSFTLPSPTHELKSRPLIHHEGKYLCPDPQHFLWAVRPRLEQILNPDVPSALNKDPRFWKDYEDNRATFLETEGLRLFAKILRHGEFFHSLKYQIVQNGENVRTELDGMVLFDDCLFLIEAKAGGFSAPGRRGAPDRMMKHVRELLASPHEQALRAKDYIEETANPVFTFHNRPKLVLDKSPIRRTFLITLTLDPLDAFTVALQDTFKTGVFAEGNFPWAVSLVTLRVLAEMLEFPSQFIDFLLRRLQITQEDRVHTMDELDYLGCFLSGQLWFQDEQSKKMGHVMLDTWTADIDRYYAFEGSENSVPKPRQSMPQRYREMLEELEKEHAPGYLEVALILHELGGETREKLVDSIELLRQKTIKDSRFHDISMHFDSYGITCWSALAGEAASGMETLTAWVEFKKYQTKSEKWIGLLTVADQPELLSGWVTRSFPWTFDNAKEEALTKLDQSQRRPSPDS